MAESTKSTAPAETPKQKPSLGRIVLVPDNLDHNNGSPVAPAVITAVHADTINVRIWADNSDNPEWRTSLHQVDSPDDFEKVEPGKSELHLWCWPPRV